MTAFTEQESAEARRRLVARLQEAGAVHSPRILDAFAEIPRERFVPLFYQQEGRSWRLRRPEEFSPEDWLVTMYQDDALVTKISERNLPICSSSMPSLMALMLEELEVQPGLRVREIGVGTGYNAALLARLTGDPSLVTTTEIDQELAEQAERTLHQLVGPVQVLRGDGAQDIAPDQRYDRLIATASAPGIPRIWYEQLADRGKLVMPLQGSLNVGGLLVLMKGSSQGIGHFEPISLNFMPLRGNEQEVSARTLFRLPEIGEVLVRQNDPVLVALQDQQFRWFLQWAWPQAGWLSIHLLRGPGEKQAYLLKDAKQMSILQLNREPEGDWRGRQHGHVALWQEVARIYQKYLALRQPTKEMFRVQVKDEQATLCVPFAQEDGYLRNLFV